MHIYILPIEVQFCKFCKNAKKWPFSLIKIIALLKFSVFLLNVSAKFVLALESLKGSVKNWLGEAITLTYDQQFECFEV